MRIPPLDLGFLLDRSQELCGRVVEAWEDQGLDATGPSGPEGVATGIGQLFALLEGPETPAAEGEARGPVGGTELSDLAAYGVGLLSELAACARRAGMHDEASVAHALTVPFSILMARRGAELTALEPVVDALANLANELSDAGDLAQLFGLMGEIASAVSPAATQYPAQAEPRQPWGVLLLNRAIVATRSHRPALMELAFDAVVEHLPHEAARFFEEGMAQMDALDYPPHVRAVMERYYLRQGPAPHTLH